MELKILLLSSAMLKKWNVSLEIMMDILCASDNKYHIFGISKTNDIAVVRRKKTVKSIKNIFSN